MSAGEARMRSGEVSRPERWDPAQPRLGLRGQLIGERRRELGLSKRRFAKALGVSVSAIGRLEAGGNHGDLNLRLLERLADLLACSVAVLLRDAKEVDDEDRSGDNGWELKVGDAANVQALLFAAGRIVSRADLARALGWELKRIDRALGLLAATAEHHPSGITVQRGSQGVVLRPRLERLDREALARLERAHQARNGLHLGSARLLRRVARGEVDWAWELRANNPERVALQSLLRARLIERGPAQFELAHEVRLSLGLGSSADVPE